MRAVAMCSAIVALIGIPCAASAAQLYNFRVGSWQGGAFTNQAGTQFNHCGASASYNSGVIVSFAVSRTYQWSMAFSHQGWRLTPRQAYNIAFTVDQDPPIAGRAVAISATTVEVVLADSSQLFQRFRQGQQLRVAAAGQTFTFNLTGTSQLLPALLRCVQANLSPRPAAPTVAANPFVTPAPAGSPSQGRPPAFRAEAVSLAANVLGSAGQLGFRILDANANAAHDAAWTANRTFGLIRIEPKDRPEVISAATIAIDAAGCKSKFASGSMPASQDELPRLFTKCGEGNDALTVYYFIVPRKAGGYYLVGTGALGPDEPARQAESDIRQATMVVTAR